MVYPKQQLHRVCLVLFLLAVTTLPSLSGKITGTVSPLGKNVRVELWYLDSEFHCACDSYMGEKGVDSTGRFTFQGLRKGIYGLSVIPKGLRCLPRTVEKITVGDKTIDIGIVRLQPSAWVTGKVSPPGGNLGVYADSVPNTSCQVGADGSFELDGLPIGKHKLRVWRDDCVSQTVEVEISRLCETRLAPIKLVSQSDATGTLTGKLLYANSPASQDDLDTGHVQLRVFALPTDTASCSGRPSAHYFTPSHAIEPITGEYTIKRMRPGRYELLACGPGSLVRGVSDLPADTAPSSDDTKAVLEAIKVLGTAFDAGDEQSVRNCATAQCIFSQTGRADDCTALLKTWSEGTSVPGERRVVLIRAGRERAVVFSRAQAISKKDQQGRAYEFIESWRFVRDPSGWKLAKYHRESEMMELLSTLRISSPGHPKAPCTVDQLAPVSIVITDDPKLANVSVEAGKVALGHDFDLRTQ